MPVSGKRHDKALVRVDPPSHSRRSNEAESVAVCRCGLLQQPEQRQVQDAQDQELLKLLVVFTRELIRNSCGSDAIFLAANSAKNQVNPSQEVLLRFTKAIALEHSKNYFPKGF